MLISGQLSLLSNRSSGCHWTHEVTVFKSGEMIQSNIVKLVIQKVIFQDAPQILVMTPIQSA